VLILFAALFAILLISHLCHIDILWSDEDYHQAAALQVLHGKVLYRDLWYDKPPLNAYAYLLFGAAGGAVLRLASAIYALAVCLSAFHFARRIWSLREGYIAAMLAAFSLIFYFPSATITLEPDTWMILLQLWAVYFAWRKRPLVAGLLSGLGMLFNVKAIFVLAACAAVGYGAGFGAGEFATLAWLAVGFLIPNAIGIVWLRSVGAWPGYVEQVWRWGFLYAGSTGPVSSALASGVVRAGNWAAFHAALVLGALWCWWHERENRLKWIAWTLTAVAASAVGWRFLPRYLDQLLPPLIVVASRGVALGMRQKHRLAQVALGIALLIPIIRFGPRYAILASETLRGVPHEWSDIAMDRDSRAAATLISRGARPGDTLFVWGYRPDIFVYTKLPAASRFWDSQPLTGVAADRHLVDDRPTLGGNAAAWAAANRAELVRSRPDVIADGLSLYNPRLDIHRYADLAQWLAAYCEVGRTAGTIIYRRCDDR
jgi:4-amino-4-deoxy-L-arabinose transferase-like glycosyltransferase